IDTVFSSFQSCITSEVSIPNAPQYEVYAREYRIVGKVYKNGYLSWIQKQARTLRINGYVKYLSKNEIAVFSSGSKKNMKEFNKILNNEKPRKVIIESIIDSGVSIEDLPPIKIGFELRVSKQNQSAYNKKLKL